ncbi:hypothetical protein FK004_06660 [Flavobacterium kingsejongi]|uniref:Uncharacterized protein n=1 Tax=Flavobacterium kingsejongi TaxID=1678728 RepID=A0A2S1LMF3_9FLAO|nr:hypothetical protein FK004_06660 [Flavobacterium kingsejongi]
MNFMEQHPAFHQDDRPAVRTIFLGFFQKRIVAAIGALLRLFICQKYHFQSGHNVAKVIKTKLKVDSEKSIILKESCIHRLKIQKFGLSDF